MALRPPIFTRRHEEGTAYFVIPNLFRDNPLRTASHSVILKQVQGDDCVVRRMQECPMRGLSPPKWEAKCIFTRGAFVAALLVGED